MDERSSFSEQCLPTIRFDIPNLPVEQRTVEDEPGMLKSSQLLKDLIESEISSTGINPDRIILGGFSQGGALSILTGLTYERHLAGVVALSCYAPLRDKLKKVSAFYNCRTMAHVKSYLQIVNPALSKIPLFVGHGTHDPLISVTFADKTLEYLTTELGYSRATSDSPAGIEFHKYGGLEHSTSMEELQDLKSWIKKVVPA